MWMTIDHLPSAMFSESDLQRIRDAVRAAERRTRGEIVPMIVPRSAVYREASHRGGLLTALLTLTIFLTAEVGWGARAVSEFHPWVVMVAVVAAYVIGHYVGSCPWGIRFLVTDHRMADKVRRRAELAFYEQGLHRTREATGVLIHLSLLERRVQILADRAINEIVSPETWDSIVRTIVDGIRGNRPTDALCDAIASCGDLLARHFPPTPGDNPNELPDAPVVL